MSEQIQEPKKLEYELNVKDLIEKFFEFYPESRELNSARREQMKKELNDFLTTFANGIYEDAGHNCEDPPEDYRQDRD